MNLQNFTSIDFFKNISIEQFDYPLPSDRIALYPLHKRDSCRLLVRRPNGTLEHRVFDELPDLLPDNAMLVCNNTRVIKARLRFVKATGAQIEIMCLEPYKPRDYALSLMRRDACVWTCAVGNGKRWRHGPLVMTLMHPTSGDTVKLTALRVEQHGADSTVSFEWDAADLTFSDIIQLAGVIPIPPYLNRDTQQSDVDDYQTVYGRVEGSVAAPTAGLHFTPDLLKRLDDKNVATREVTLHVGAGTFKPVKAESIAGHDMHSESINVSRDLLKELSTTSRPIVAVGTTSVRTLESLYHLGCMVLDGEDPRELSQWYPYEHVHTVSRAEAFGALVQYLDSLQLNSLQADTAIMIASGYRYRVVDAMITNFHQPRSTLLLLVSAWTDGDWKRMYAEALSKEYRFLSYGDAQLLL